PQQLTPVPTPTIVPSISLQNLPTFDSVFKFEDRVKVLEDDFSEFKQTNQFAAAVSSIPGIVDTYLANKMNEAVKTAVQLQSDRLRDEAQAENEDFINKLDDNIKKIIKEQVKAQVKEQVTKILPRIEKTVNEQLEAEILTRSSNEAKTSHAVAANLSELELKKILIDKMESNKSIHRSDQQKTLYKALVDAYESDKLILDTYGDTVKIKRRQDDQVEDEEPSAGSNRGSKRRRDRKELESTSAPKEKTSKSSGKSKEGSKSHNTPTGKFAQKPTKPPTPNRDLNNTSPAAHEPIQSWISNLAQKEDTRDSFNELMDTPLDFSAFGLVELRYFLEEVCKTTTDKLDWNNPEGQQYLHDLRKPLPLIPNSQVRRNDDKLYTFKEGGYKRLRLQDIEDMLLLLVQGKLTNLTIEERLALNVSLRMFTRSIVIQRRVEDLFDKKNKLMRIDELHKFSDGTLNDVRTALDDILKRIRMKYLPQTYWKKFDESNTNVLERFYTSVGNPVKEILLKLNLPDHRSILTDSKMEVKWRSIKVKEFQRSFRHSDTEHLSRSDEVL
ncbi:hypothetical protein Tco_0959733, partial [Tanacetum coccineum]